MFSIKPVTWDEAEEELGAVSVWSSISHGKIASLGVLDCEVLILELHSVDGLTTGTISSSKISSLSHELSDDAMERRSLEVEWLA